MNTTLGKAIYSQFRKKLFLTTLGRVVALGFISVLLVLALLPSMNGLAAFLGAAIVVYGIWRTIADQSRLPIAIEGSILAKYIQGRFSGYFKLNVSRAVAISPDGVPTPVDEWLGERTVRVPFSIFKSFHSQDKVSFVCLNSGPAVDTLEKLP